MAVRLEQVVVNALDPVALGRWWAAALGWPVVCDEPDEFEIRPAPDVFPGLLFACVPESGEGIKNRVHLDLTSKTVDDQAAIVERLLAAGATKADIGQGEQTWVVLRDPEHNEFCVLAPNPRTIGHGALAGIAFDAADPHSIAPFWATVLGWTLEPADDGGDVVVRDPARPAPYLEFLAVPEPKVTLNRLHLDLRPVGSTTQAAEVERVLALGAARNASRFNRETAQIATRFDGEADGGPQSWVVLRDPDGNEFCVLASLTD